MHAGHAFQPNGVHHIDIGCSRGVSDEGVLRDSTLGTTLFGEQNDMLNIPSPGPLPGRVHAVSFVEVGDDAFPLRNNLMKSYPLRNLSSEQRVFICHLSHAQRVVAFVLGIFTNRF